MGDPAGIGPEIILKALEHESLYQVCRPVILGDPGILHSMGTHKTPPAALNVISAPLQATPSPGKTDVLAVSDLTGDAVRPGAPTPAAGRAMVDYIIRAVEMTLSGDLAAMVTCPISKALMQQAGYAYEGHTQLISHLTGTRDVVMMLAGERLRVALATIHCPLREVPALLSEAVVYKTIAITGRALDEDLGIRAPRIAVAGLNPHAGEEGLFGTEERDIIEPAVRRANESGLLAMGPFPPDTLFYRAASGEFDAVVAMYHDQGLIPLKLLHFSDGVNVTLGLPIIRTSVDHGTAYDIAGSGRADPSSLIAAIRMASRMVRNRASSKARATG
jgi:4-hydroxythreonine-4-phosphate dehydrogenase